MIGIGALLLLWISAGISVPLVKQYSHFRPEALLIVRGAAVALAFLIFKRIFEKPNKFVILGALLLAISSITFFQALNLWSPNPVIVVITLVPLVNFWAAFREKRKIGRITMVSLILILLGVSMALDVFREKINLPGLLLSVVATVCAGLGVEGWSKTKESAGIKMVWYSYCLVPLAFLVLFVTEKRIVFIPPETSLWIALYVFSIIGCLSGVFYLYAVGVVIEKFGPTKGSILLQGETPAVIIGTWLVIGTTISFRQGFGVGLMLLGISILLWQMTQDARKSPTPSSS